MAGVLRAVILAGALLAVGLGAPAAGPPAPAPQPPLVAGTQTLNPPPVPPPSPPAAAAAGDPRHLLIPRLGIDAAVEAVGLDAQGRMDVPADARDVGWYQPGVRPGADGDAVIDGHSDWYTGPAVFHDLGAIAVGDSLVVETGGGRLTFSVDSVSAHPYNATVPGLFSREGPPQLTLITCAGDWDPRARAYLERLIVHATLVTGANPSNL